MVIRQGLTLDGTYVMQHLNCACKIADLCLSVASMVNGSFGHSQGSAAGDLK